jgi:hypothetical protein
MKLRWTSIPVALGLLLFAGGAARSAEKPTPADITKLIGQLGGDDKDASSAARKKLAEIGLPALASLRKVIFETKAAAQRKDVESVVKQITTKAQKDLEDRLVKIKAKGAMVQQITEKSLARLFPAYLFFSVRFQLYPVAVRPRAPLLAQNLFIIDKDGQMDHVTEFQAIHDFFTQNVGKVLKENEGKAPGRALLALWQELIQDGYYKFSIPDKEVRVGEGTSGIRVIARAIVKPENGNKGYLKVTLDFGLTGNLRGIAREKTIYKGKRPKQ